MGGSSPSQFLTWLRQLEIVNEFLKVARYKVNKQKSIVFSID